MVLFVPFGLYDHLRGDDGVLGQEKERLLGRKVPLLAEALIAVACAELPERDSYPALARPSKAFVMAG
jgi:hypothetical protein